MSKHYKNIVLGGGNAAGYLAREWVAQGGPKGELAIIGEEPYVSYERPALSKAYLFPEAPARLPGFHACVGGGGDRQLPEFYVEHGIDYLTGTRVTGVDVGAKSLTTAGGQTITWDKLVVATGARPATLVDFKTPGADLGGVHYLRNVQDADALVAAIAACKAAGGKAVAIGGGYIGMECAAALALNGLDVTMVFPEDRLMSRLFTPELAAFYESFYQGKGIKLVKGDIVTALEGGADGRVAAAVLKSGGRLEASLVLVGVGARPNTDLLAGQVELLAGPPGGIKVNEHLQASHPDVYAIGDVAAFPLQLTGGAVVRQEHVTCCRLTAAHVARELLGKPAAFDYQPFFYSRVFNLSWQFYGLSEGAEVVPFGDQAAAKFGAFFVAGGKVVGAFLEGGSAEENAAIKRVAAAQPAAPADLGVQGLGFALAQA